MAKKETAAKKAVASVGEASARFSWLAIRSLLTDSAERKLREFAAAHQDETFYCLCVYFDGYYGDFFLYLNTQEHWRTQSQQIRENYPALYPQQSLKDVEERHRWNCGDFVYAFINDDAAWRRVWDPIRREYHDFAVQLYRTSESEGEAWSVAWAETACAVALDLEQGGVLETLRKTKDFQVICVDHDETIEESNSRLEHVRRSYYPLNIDSETPKSSQSTTKKSGNKKRRKNS